MGKKKQMMRANSIQKCLLVILDYLVQEDPFDPLTSVSFRQINLVFPLHSIPTNISVLMLANSNFPVVEYLMQK